MNNAGTTGGDDRLDEALSEEHSGKRLRDIAAALGATWQLPVLATIALLIVAVGVLAFLRIILPSTTTFISQFHFTFPSAEQGRYPNSVAFSINEILDPAALDVVYDQLELQKYGIGREKFYSGFSIRPFVPTEAEISERFRQQLADRRLSFGERERLEQQLRNQIEQASRGAAELSFTVEQRLPPPTEIGRAIVQKVPLVWSQIAIEKKGVLRIPGFSAAAEVVSPSIVEKLPPSLAIAAVVEAVQRLSDRLTELMKTPGVLTVRDPGSSKSIRDIDRDIRDLKLFQVDPLRAALVTYQLDEGGDELQRICERRINEIEIEAADLTRQAQAAGDSIAQFVQANAGLKGRPVERRTADGSVVAEGGATIPQVGESFIDRIIELTRRDREAEQIQTFVMDRTNVQFDLNQRAILLRGEQKRWKELLADLRSDSAARKQMDEPARARLSSQLRHAVTDTNADWAALSRIEAEFAANRTGRTAEIYAPYAVHRDVIWSDPVLNWNVASAVLSGLVIFLLGFWAARASVVLARPSRPGAPA
jgi:hypothetical protein